MKTQISHVGHAADKRYSGVYQQQGRMITDRDWNELVTVLRERLERTLGEIVGDGIPRLAALRVEKVSTGYQLQPGTAYVDGLRAELPGSAAVPFGDQPDFPGAPLPTNDCRVYLDLWERTVVSLEDAGLRDAGLHGADTCTRTQTMLQVKCCPAAVSPLDEAQNPKRGGGRVSVALWDNSEAGDRIDPCLTQSSGAARIGNYLFRLEVHDAKRSFSGSTETLELVLKWSSENGAEQQSLAWRDQAGAPQLDYLDLPPDFTAGHFSYEIYDDACEKHLGVHLAPGFTPARGVFRSAAELTGTPPQVAGRPPRYIRRWDGYLTLKLTRTTAARNWVPDVNSLVGVDKGQALRTDTPGYGYVEFPAAGAGKSLRASLEGLIVSLELGAHDLVPGDYWLAVLREGAELYPDVAIDRRVEVLNGGAPLGVVHHYLELSRVVGGAVVPYTTDGVEQRRLDFPPLTALTADRVGYDSATQGTRWDDINEVAGGTPRRPITVQEALDDLVQNLESSDVSYVLPPCQTTSYGSATVNALLGPDIANQVVGSDGKTRTKLEDLANALLCKLDARRIPYDPTQSRGRWADVLEQAWAKQFGGAGSEDNRGLAVDANGNIFLTGTFSGTTVFEGHVHASTGGFADVYLAKLDPMGRLLWFRSFGASLTDRGDALTLDAAGNIYLLGRFSGTLALPNLPPITSVGGEDVFIARFDTNGNAAWVRQLGGTSLEIGYAIAASPSGQLCVCGAFAGVASVPLSAVAPITSAGPYDMFVLMLAANGDVVVLRRFGGPQADYALAVAAAPSGGFVLAGRFAGDVAFGSATLHADTNADLVVVRLDQQANVAWARGFGGAIGTDVAVGVGDDGSIFVFGTFTGTMKFEQNLSGSNTSFLTRLGSDGAPQWSRQLPALNGAQVSMGLVLRGAQLGISGYFFGTIDFGGGPISSAGNYDAFLALFDLSGTFQKASVIDGSGHTHRNRLGLAPDGKFILAGNFTGIANFGDTVLTSSGGNNVFVTKVYFDQTGPRTVQAAIDELLNQLDSGDIGYLLPSCSDHDSVRSRLPGLAGLPIGAGVDVAKVLDALLCQLDSSSIPFASSDPLAPAGSVRDLMVKKIGDSMTGALTITPPATVSPALKVNGTTETQDLRLIAPAGTPDRAVLTYESASGLARWRETALTAWLLSAGNLSTNPTTTKVGIGTAAPVAKLQVVDGAIMPAAGNSTDRGIQFPSDPGGGGGDAAWIRYYARAGESTTLEIGVSNDADDHIALMPSAAAGGVGIGTNAPVAKLQVVGGAIMPSAGNAANRGIQFPSDPGGGGGDAAWIRYYARAGESTTLEIGVSNDADDNIALISSGNVGIGTRSPVNRLDVAGDIAINAKHCISATADGWLRFNQSNANSSGTHTPGLFAPGCLNVGARGGWVNPGDGNAWVRGTLTAGAITSDNNISAAGEISQSGAFLRVRGAGTEMAYFGGDGASNDVQIGSTRAAIMSVACWNTASGGWMDIAFRNSNAHSDIRSKTNIEPIQGALGLVKRLRGVRFDWKDENQRATTGKESGFIAQEVREVLPSVVREDGRGMLSITLNALPAYLVEAVKEQQTQIEALQAQVAQLSEKLSKLLGAPRTKGKA